MDITLTYEQVLEIRGQMRATGEDTVTVETTNIQGVIVVKTFDTEVLVNRDGKTLTL